MHTRVCMYLCSAGFKAPDKAVVSGWLVMPCHVEENEYLNDLQFPIVRVYWHGTSWGREGSAAGLSSVASLH